MAKKSPNKGFDKVEAEELERLVSDLKEVVKGLDSLANALKKERLPPISLPIASRIRAVENLVSLNDRLPGFLNAHRRASAGEKAGETRKSEHRQRDK